MPQQPGSIVDQISVHINNVEFNVGVIMNSV